MFRTRLWLCLLCGCGIAMSASGATHGKYSEIALMELQGQLVVITAEGAVATGTATNVEETAASLEKGFPKALQETKGHPALATALKEYYSALRSVLGGLDPQAEEPQFVYRARISGLETKAKEARDRLDVELQALGVAP